MKGLKITPKITKRDDVSLEKYLSDVSREEMITYAEEVELAKKIKMGDKDALNKLVRANLRFVISVAKQYQNQGLPLQDLITEGNIGLIKAAQRFDETKGFKFISYAVWWIRQSILQAIAEHSRIVRLPLNRITNISKINKILAKAEQENGNETDIFDLAEKYGINPNEIQETLMFNTKSASLDAPVSSSDDSVNLLELLVLNDDSESPDKILDYESLKTDLNRLINTLTPREIQILNEIYGLNGHFPLSLDEVAKKHHLSKERVRQIKDKAIAKLKHSQKKKIVQSYITSGYTLQ